MNGSLGILQDMAKCVEQKDIHPVIANVYEWQNTKEGYKALLNQGFVGKLVVKIP